MATMKKVAPKKPTVSRTPSKAVKKPLAKKVNLVDQSYFNPNDMYKLPMTPAQMKAFNKLNMSPKTSQTMFTLPKGTEKLSALEKKQIQAQRLLDRQRTLARAASIIRRTR